VGGLLALLVLLAVPSVAHAQDEEGPRKVVDARLEGLHDVSSGNESPIKVDDKASGMIAPLNWLLFIVLAGIACAVVFKDARRSHLD
jgi:hypothetical protein